MVSGVLMEVYGPQELQHVLGWLAVEHKTLLYEEDVRIVFCNPIWLKTALKMVVIIFEIAGLQTNLGKTN